MLLFYTILGGVIQ